MVNIIIRDSLLYGYLIIIVCETVVSVMKINNDVWHNNVLSLMCKLSNSIQYRKRILMCNSNINGNVSNINDV